MVLPSATAVLRSRLIQTMTSGSYHFPRPLRQRGAVMAVTGLANMEQSDDGGVLVHVMIAQDMCTAHMILHTTRWQALGFRLAMPAARCSLHVGASWDL